MAPAKQLLGSKPVSARHLRHRRFARERLRDDLRLGLRRPASPPACPRNHLDPAEVPSVTVKRMVIHMVKPIPMKESRPSRITIAHAMWGRNYAYGKWAPTQVMRLLEASALWTQAPQPREAW